MTTFKNDLHALEKALRQASVPVEDVLAAAGVDRSTWSRWKNDRTIPRFENWLKVRNAADRLIKRARVSA